MFSTSRLAIDATWLVFIGYWIVHSFGNEYPQYQGDVRALIPLGVARFCGRARISICGAGVHACPAQAWKPAPQGPPRPQNLATPDPVRLRTRRSAAFGWKGGTPKRQSNGSVLFCRSTQQSLLRLLTTDAVHRPYGNPALSNAEAWTFYRDLRADPRCGFAREPKGIETRWKALAARESASPKLWMDAYLAAFALSAGHGFVTTDEGFRQFDGLPLTLLSKATGPR